MLRPEHLIWIDNGDDREPRGDDGAPVSSRVDRVFLAIMAMPFVALVLAVALIAMFG